MRFWSPLLLALAALPAAETTVINAAKTITVSGTPATVSVVRFWQSADAGKSWSLAQQASVAPEAKSLPSWSFAPGKDGEYLIVTSVTGRDGKAEADPKPGEIPARALAVGFDATPPAIAGLTATLQSSDPSAPSATITVAWKVADEHLATTDIELSRDAGATWSQAQTGGATGAVTLTVPRDGTPVSVRINATDAAGNRATSPVQVVQVPAALKPEEALAKAVAALPALATVAPVVTAPAPAGTAATPDAPVVVVPEGSPLTGAPILATPAPTTPAGTVAEKPAEKAGETPAPVSTTPRDVTRPSGTKFLSGAAADEILAQARIAADVDAALPLYLRLLDSSLAEISRDELLAALEKANDPATVVAVVDGLSPELKDDATRLRHGEALLRLGRFADAQDTVAKVRRGSPQLRKALLVTAKALQGQGKTAHFTRLVEKLAAGDDEVAAEATRLRGK